MRTRSLAVLIASAAVLSLNALPARATSFASVIVFGDSLSDNGNLYAATVKAGPPVPVIPPSPPYDAGRFSNGPVAVEQLAAMLNAPLYDFAFGGATTGIGNIGDGGTQTASGGFGLPGIAAEFAGATLPPSLIANSLFVVWGGADDFESQGSAVTAAGNIDGIVSQLEFEGATHILVPGLPNIGQTPEFFGDSLATDYTNTFNTALLTGLPAGAIYVDTDTLLASILANGNAYGFSNTTGQCLADGANPDCTGYLFFDDIHPTTAADTLLANDFFAAVTPTPEPSSLLLLGTGLAASTGILRRRKTTLQRP